MLSTEEAGNFSATKLLADNGSDVYQNQLGIMYQHGNGVQQDYSKAASYYEKAAQQGFPGAFTNLGNLYEHGLGVPQDYLKAASYYRQAVREGGSPLAWNKLGFLHQHGLGVKQSYEQAMECYAHAMGDCKVADYNAFTITSQGRQENFISGRYVSPDEIERPGFHPGFRKDHKERLYKAAYLKRIKEPGFLEDSGKHHNERLDKAHTYLEQKQYSAAFTQFYCLANIKIPKAKDQLVQMCLNGQVTSEENVRIAIDFFKKEHEEGDPKAAFLVAQLTMEIPFYTVFGRSHDTILTALEWYKKAASGEKKADNFKGEASYELAMLLQKTKAGPDKVRDHLKNAYSQGCSKALEEIFTLSEKYRTSYESSLIFIDENDLVIANDLLEFAVDKNHLKAKTRQDEIQALQVEKALENNHSFFNVQPFSGRKPNDFNVTDDHL